MTAFGRLIRTTAFKLLAVYLAVFVAFAAAVVIYLGRHTQRLAVEQAQEVLASEISALSDVYRRGGVRRLASVMEWRARQPGSNIYLLTTGQGESIVGNIAPLSGDALEKSGWIEVTYRRIDDAEGIEHEALASVSQLPGGFRIVVGRDLDERERIRAILARPVRWAILLVVVLGVAGGLFVTRRVLKRVDSIGASAGRIMTGDLSGRLPVVGTGDEFDRLAGSLNVMLERIDGLMRGLREVSDNIAHDLKTPLTRLRNRAEEALRTAKTEDDWRNALEGTIEDADGLISTFNALLMIARAEAGRVDSEMERFDAAEVVRTVAELYEPVAEERSASLVVAASGTVPVQAWRELLGQALANLVDNALKYGIPNGGQPTGAIVTLAARCEGDKVILSVSDNGPGIPEADRIRAVERFVRLESSRSLPGSGLGLSLAAAVARLHGGTLALTDNQPGLAVTLTLPRGQPVEAKVAT